MASLGSPLRLLYTQGFEGWDYSWAGILTDYLIVLTCATVFAFTGYRGKVSNRLRNLLFAFLISTGLTYGFGGAAHHLINIYFHSGTYMGRQWGDENSGWMIPWIIGVVAMGFAAAALFALTFEILSLPAWASLPALLAAVGIGIYEVYVLFGTDTGFDNSSYAVALFSTFASLVCTVAHAVGLCVKRSNRALLLGTFLQLLGFLLLLVAPASCTKANAAREGCPFPKDFNQNALFHVALAIATYVISLGVWQMRADGQSPVPEGDA